MTVIKWRQVLDRLVTLSCLVLCKQRYVIAYIPCNLIIPACVVIFQVGNRIYFNFIDSKLLCGAALQQNESHQ